MKTNFTANGTVSFQHSGGPLTVQATGTWGGGTLSINADFGTGTATTEYQMTGDETRIFDFEAGADIDIILSGATAPNLNVVAV